MDSKQLFLNHYRRLRLEAVLRSALGGLAIGFGANFAAALAAWLFDFGGIWMAIGVGAGVAVLSGVLLYFLKYRPDPREVAARVDRLGLKERSITMLELEGDDSVIAKLQRENAREYLGRVKNSKVAIGVSKALVCLAVCGALVGSSMTVVVGLAENDIIPSVPELVAPDESESFVSVTYAVDEGGEIVGETDQLIPPGSDATPVVAVPEDGWVFVGWDDGNENPERCDRGVQSDIYVFAIFEEIGEGGDGDTEAEGEGKPGSMEGDKAEDLPEGGSANADSDQNGGNGEKGDGSGSDGNNDGGQGSGQEQGDGKGEGQGLGAGGKWEDANQFIDGNTYYKDHLDMYYQYALELFEQNGEIPPELIEFFETYYDSI